MASSTSPTTAASPTSKAASTSAAARLFDRVRQARLLDSTAAILSWDQETMMPPRGVEHRSRQMAQLAGLSHQMFTDPAIGDLLAAAEAETGSLPATAPERVNVREIRRDWTRATKLPAALVEELAQVSSTAQHEWAEARRDSDFKRFRPWLERLVELNRRKAECFGWNRQGGEAWDALADGYEAGCTAAAVERVFTPLRTRLQALLDRIRGASRRPDGSFNDFALPVDAQERFVRAVAQKLGFDFERGRLDRSTHPFCGGSHRNDVRLTTRYNPTCLNDALGSTMHEAGHGMYEQGLPAEWIGLPMGEAVSLSIHESQSRLWENQVGRSEHFWRWARTQLPEHFGAACGRFSLEQLVAAANVVEAGFIRVEADEATYNMHVMIRFSLERVLIGGQLSIGDLPGAWNELYRDYLGVVVPDDRRGCLQDVHWSMGAFGYFPTYTLGTLHAAQFHEAACRELPGLPEDFSRGDFSRLLGWLNRRIHAEGRRWLSGELCRHVTGSELSADPLMRHLEAKLVPLYGL